MTSVLEALQGRVARHPDKVLYVFMGSDGRVIQRHTYQSFLARIDVIASHLMSGNPLHAGDRVLLVYPPGLEMIAALFACARAGLIPVPVPPPSTYGYAAAADRMRHIAHDCAAAAVLTSHDCEAQLRRHARPNGQPVAPGAAHELMKVPWIISDTLVEQQRLVPRVAPRDILFLQYTSGSTSSPKGVIVTHANVLHNCRLAVDHEAPVAVSWLPQHHDMGLLGYYVYIALTGGTTHGFSPASFIQRPALWLETISAQRATASSAPNFAFEYCLRSGRVSETTLGALDLSSLRYLMAAAEPIKPETYRRFLHKFEPHGLRRESFFVAYGLAENTLAVTNYGRATISVSKVKLSAGEAQRTRETSGVDDALHLMSCGTPLSGNTVRIVDPERNIALADGRVGEIWIRGVSKSPGYWNNAEMTRQTFCAQITNDRDDGMEYLRTGDLGFIEGGELYVCGRRKDMIIVRGQNYFPQDIEALVESASTLVRPGCVAAFDLGDETRAPVGIVAEITNRGEIPDARAIAVALREGLGLDIGLMAFVPPKSIPRTSSGKIVRYMARRLYLTGELTVLSQYVQESTNVEAGELDNGRESAFEALKRRYHLTGDEAHTLIQAGMDSIDLVVFLHELKELLAARGADLLSQQVDVRLIQRVSVATLFQLVDHFERESDVALEQCRRLLASLREEHLAEEQAMMLRDRSIAPLPPKAPSSLSAGRRGGTAGEGRRAVLLTGGTGFLGPFLLRSLLEQTDASIHVLVRARTEGDARDRLIRVLQHAFTPSRALAAQLDDRVVAVCGNLEAPRLGLTEERWRVLADNVEAIYHNAATVNYLFNYATMRASNVGGTEEVLRLAFDGRPKQCNHISTTFVFGWARKPVLYETDRNLGMERLDFGYSQTKWVAEQKVFDAMRRGLATRVFRPSLITPSLTGGGTNIDITIRLIAFMIKHGIGVSTLNQVSFLPADVTANNIVAIATQPETVGGTFHVTRDEYSNMVDVIDIISASTGRHFELFPLREFVPEVIQRCTKGDLLYPLLDFFVGSVENIAAMEFKRYDNTAYRAARNANPMGVGDPALADTVQGMLAFMARNGIA